MVVASHGTYARRMEAVRHRLDTNLLLSKTDTRFGYLYEKFRLNGLGHLVSIIHRSDRCDLSLFQLCLRLLDKFLNEDLPIPVAFHVFI